MRTSIGSSGAVCGLFSLRSKVRFEFGLSLQQVVTGKHHALNQPLQHFPDLQVRPEHRMHARLRGKQEEILRLDLPHEKDTRPARLNRVIAP